MSNTFLDVHIIQTLPPSNLNRDDTGSPKSARFGGVRRARVSSQAWKRATRTHFSSYLPVEDIGVRTRRIKGLLIEKLLNRYPEYETEIPRIVSAVVLVLLKQESKKTKKSDSVRAEKDEDKNSQYLLFVGNRQIDNIVKTLGDNFSSLIELKDKELFDFIKQIGISDLFQSTPSFDIALFGRMVADVPSYNIDASCQVAHALSTHGVEAEFDYFTAVDDLLGANETGAGMIGTIEFNSATFYRYASLDINQLFKTLDNSSSIVTATIAFLESFIKSVPTGYQNSFAHQTLPELILVAIREDQPINLIGAFEKPVVANEKSISTISSEKLIEHFKAINKMYSSDPVASIAAYLPSIELEGFTPVTVPDLVSKVEGCIANRISNDHK